MNDIYVIVENCHLEPIYYAETREELDNYVLNYIEDEFNCIIYQISKVPTSPL